MRAHAIRHLPLALATLTAFTSVTAHAQPATAAAPAPTAAAGPTAAHAAPKPMTMMSTVIPCTDLEKSTAFYTRGLGMTAARGANPREVVLGLPGGGPNLMLLKSDAGPTAPHRGPARVILNVPDIKALSTQLQAAGFALKGPIREIAQYRISVAELEDPDGNSFELIQRGG
ncbi:MAG: VOC family protein [Novosphingobium sp.]